MDTDRPVATARHRAAVPHILDPARHAEHIVYLSRQRLIRAEHERDVAQANVERARRELEAARANLAVVDPGNPA